MRTSESIKELAGALSKAQGVMSAAKKDVLNPHFNKKYADLASCWDACREPLSANGLSVIQTTRVSDKDEVVVITRLLHASGEWFEGELALPVSKADAQGYGSALTYTRRYGLCSIVGIAPEEDDANAAAAAKPSKADGAIPGNVEGRAILDAYDAATKAVMQKHAMALQDMFREGRAADMVGYVAKEQLTNEMKMAVWTLLPSAVRTAYKKADAETRSLAEQG